MSERISVVEGGEWNPSRRKADVDREMVEALRTELERAELAGDKWREEAITFRRRLIEAEAKYWQALADVEGGRHREADTG